MKCARSLRKLRIIIILLFHVSGGGEEGGQGWLSLDNYM